MARSRVFSGWHFVVFGSLFQAMLVFGNDRNFNPFYFTLEPVDMVIQKGQPAILNCSAFGNPRPTVEWKKDGLFLNLLGDTRRTILPSGALRINNVTHSRNDRPDEGNYECVATVDNLGTIVSRSAKLQVADLGRIDEGPESTSVYTGDTAIFKCVVTAVPGAVIRWQKNRVNLDLATNVDERYTELESGTLEIKNVKMSDEADYRCRATNIEGMRRSEEASLSIIFSGSMVRRPEFASRPQNAEVLEGGDVVLECAVNANPRPTVTWWKDGQPITPSRNPDYHYSYVGAYNLRIKSATEQDTGTYICSASNVITNTNIDARVELLVQVTPRYEKEPTSLFAEVNSDINFECKVYGVPFPTIEWIKNGDTITPSDYFKIVEGTNLKILGLVKSDEGLYQCKASNDIGNIQTSAQLIIVDRDESLPTMPVLISTTTTSPSPTAMVGTDTSPGSRLVPTAPRDVLPQLVSTRFVDLTWREPGLTNGNIMAYSVYFRRQGSPRERVVNTTTVEERIEELIPSTRYEFRIKAYNQHGAGEMSPVLYVETQPEVQAAGPVMNLRAIALSTTVIKVLWDPPTRRNGQIDHYKLYYAELARINSEQDIEVIGLYYTVTRLNKFTDYSFRVVAYNENGPGVSSEEVVTRTYSDQPSSPPVNITMVPQSTSSIMIYWDPPPLSARNGAIIGYKLRSKQEGSRRSSVITVDGAVNSYSLDGLSKDTRYEIRMSAMTVNGTGPSTEWMGESTLPNDLDESQVPPAPTSLKVYPMTDNIHVEWTQPRTDLNIMVRGYTIGYGLGIPDVKMRNFDANQRHFTIPNLLPASQYVISLRAYNRQGSGNVIYETVTTREESTPEPQTPMYPPVGVKAIVLSATAVKVVWADSTLNKQRITDNRYYTIMYKTNYPAGSKPKMVNSTSFEYTIDDLKSSTVYEFAVKVTKGRRSSHWSLAVSNKTSEAPPGAPPKTLTAVPVEGDPTALNLNWQPPKSPNGLITGYIIYYTTDNQKVDHDWVIEPLIGDRLTTIIRDLTVDTSYYFKIQARNSQGVGPSSEVLHYRTPKDDGSVVSHQDSDKLNGRGPTSSASSNDEEGLPRSILYIIIACVVGVTFVAIVTVTIIVCRRRADENMAKKRKQGAYKAPPKGGAKKAGAKDVKPPDLWIHHDQMELKQMEKTPMMEPMTQIPRHQDDMKPLDDPPMSDTITKRNSFTGDDELDLTAQDKTLEKKRKPIMIPVDSQQPREKFRVKTQFNYPMTRSQSLERAGFMASSAGYHSDNTTISSDDGTKTLPPSLSTTRPSGHPLKSFSVPGPPPPQYPGAPPPKHNNKQSPVSMSNTPYKKPPLISPGILKSRMQPVAVNMPRAPDVAIRGTDPSDLSADGKSFSTEDLNAEMANLEGLMKDLNAITSTELEC
ncbi:neogenin [Saccoglossus kowalevskii]|uniref:Neogenin n=1 Tax=Saccoglossus kowalevskii TaxID=10224 RepID=D2XNH6_SACKO|nr:neogenin [Saccoglossus kowalevskii]ADB22606.1 neogenin [Saccoglossus kowalevskii]